MIPKAINARMCEVLDEISDEVGELSLDNLHLLKYEGWSDVCIPSHYKSEHAMINYGIRQSPKIHKEWNAEMAKRDYKAVMLEHDKHLGLYGVTYALYRRTR